MTNEEKMNEQIAAIAEQFKGMFTREELEHMEEVYNRLLASGSIEKKD